MSFGRFWYDFVVGDDWRIAAGVVLTLGATAMVVHLGHQNLWWLLPVVVLTALGLSVLAVARRELGRSDR